MSYELKFRQTKDNKFTFPSAFKAKQQLNY